MVLTFSEKVLIAFKLICGVSEELIAQELCKNVDEINSVVENHWEIVQVSHFFNLAQHMPLRGSMFPIMENVLFCWYVEVEQQNYKITTKQLAYKAKIVQQILNERPEPFTASRSWMNGFRSRFNIPIPKRKSPTAKAVAPVSLRRLEGQNNLFDSSSDTFLPEESTSSSTAEQCEPVNSSSNIEEMVNCAELKVEFKAQPDTIEKDSPTFPVVKVVKSESNVNQCSNDSDGILDGDENVVLADYTNTDANIKIVSVVSLAHETCLYDKNANDFNDSGAADIHGFIDLTDETLSQDADDETSKTNKRKRSTVIAEFGESEFTKGAEKKPKLEKVLVQTEGGLKSTSIKFVDTVNKLFESH